MLNPSAPWIVLKFGGTSVASAAAWRRILSISETHLRAGFRPLLVCSALAGVSNLLEESYDLAVAGLEYQPVYRRIVQRHRSLCEALRLPLPAEAESLIWQLRKQLVTCAMHQQPAAACKAKVMAIGELLASVLGHAWLLNQGLDLDWIDARSLLSSQDQEDSERHYLSAQCDYSRNAALAWRLAQMAPGGALTQGFIARDTEGETILLGRGGSDTSAACLAAKLGAVRLEIWTDVPGLFTAQPQLVPQARLLPELNYEQAERMAYRGARVLHPRCLAPLRHYEIPLRVCSPEMPAFEGTWIRNTAPTAAAGIQAVLTRNGLCHIALNSRQAQHEAAFSAAIRQSFTRQHLNLTSLVVTPSEASILIDTRLELPNPRRLQAALQELSPLAAAVLQTDACSLSLIGSHPVQALPQAICPELDHAIHQADAQELTVVLEPGQSESQVQHLHRSLIESQPETGFGPSWAELNQTSLTALAS
ncbi:MAG: aspartate kinase [Candidatus Sericytochromatia bacterium]